jgi:hypothetical protein
MRALFPAWSSADHLVNSSGLSKNVRLSPSIVIDKFDDCGSCLLTLFFHDPVARSVRDIAWKAQIAFGALKGFLFRSLSIY